MSDSFLFCTNRKINNNNSSSSSNRKGMFLCWRFIFFSSVLLARETVTAAAAAATKETIYHRHSHYLKGRSGSSRSHNHQQQQQEQQRLLVQDDDNTTKVGDDRIVGGNTVSQQGIFKFFVSWNGECGGSLIHSDMVLTAAHCSHISATTVTINAYKFTDAQNMNVDGEEILRTIVSKKIHTSYEGTSTFKNDFMLLKLDSPVPDYMVTPIEINTDTAVPATNQALKTIGLGLLAIDGTNPTYLQEVILQTKDDDQCSAAYGAQGYNIFHDVMFCAGRFENGAGVDSCKGDSGGPIFSLKSDGTPDKQVGVTSWGYGCGFVGFPGIYAEIAPVSDWIYRTICLFSDVPPALDPANPIDICNAFNGRTPPASDEVSIEIRVTPRSAPGSISWALRKYNTFSTLAFSQADSYTENYKLYTMNLNVKQDTTFEFEIQGTDMIYEIITYGTDNEQQLLFGSQGGLFGFQTPGAATPNPTPYPTTPFPTPSPVAAAPTATNPTNNLNNGDGLLGTGENNQDGLVPQPTSSPSIQPNRFVDITPTEDKPQNSYTTPVPAPPPPTNIPTRSPTTSPTLLPTAYPTTQPPTTQLPTLAPQPGPTTELPTPRPTTSSPTSLPTLSPTSSPPTSSPSLAPQEQQKSQEPQQPSEEEQCQCLCNCDDDGICICDCAHCNVPE